jgi:cytoskeletal protein RodZ
MDVGAQLRTSREARGLSIDAVAHTTRVQPRIIAAIEQNDITVVPPRPFGRGFVRAYAREVGLDADAVTRDYFAQFAPVEPPAPPEEPSEVRERLPWTAAAARWPLAIAAAAAVLAIVTMALVRDSSPPRSDADAPTAIGTSGSSAPGPASGDETRAVQPVATSAPAAADAPPAASPAGNLTVVISATRRAWVSARSDGRRSLYQFVLPGSPQTLTASQTITLRVGDAGALRWTINGRDAGTMGRAGEVRVLRVTEATAAAMR